jgi:hypothetical protein
MNKILNKSGELESVITKISSKNQITIPVKIIKQLGIKKNQRVKVLIRFTTFATFGFAGVVD